MESEKISSNTQWQERSERPIATRPMTKAQIEEFRKYLVMSYKCDPDDITFDFEKIFDENDEDRDDCLWLKYKMKTIWRGKPMDRIIFTTKLPIPEELRMMAEQKRKNAPTQRPWIESSTVVKIEEITESGPLKLKKTYKKA